MRVPESIIPMRSEQTFTRAVSVETFPVCFLVSWKKTSSAQIWMIPSAVTRHVPTFKAELAGLTPVDSFPLSRRRSPVSSRLDYLAGALRTSLMTSSQLRGVNRRGIDFKEKHSLHWCKFILYKIQDTTYTSYNVYAHFQSRPICRNDSLQERRKPS